MKATKVFQVEGIHCPKCVEKLVATVGPVEGISEIAVSQDMKEVSVRFESDSIDEKKIIEEIEAVPDKDFKVI